MNAIIKSLEDFEKIYNERDEIVIYGAGRVCYALLQYIAQKDLGLDKIYCILVSAKCQNPDSIMGIPVCVTSEVKNRESVTVIIATFEKTHASILEKLEYYNYNCKFVLANILYAELRKANKDFAADIMQNTQWIRDDLNNVKHSNSRILEEICAIKNQISNMEICLRNNVRYYEELLNKEQLEKNLKEWYFHKTGKVLDLENPQTYNEKIQWTKMYGVTPLMTKLSDKYAVREWVIEKIGDEYLVPLFGVWDDFDDIDFSKLPEQFVLKCNHGSGWNEIVTDKSNWNINEARRKFKHWIKMNYAFVGGLELQYRDIIPKIIAEMYIEDMDKEIEKSDLPDYKFFCFDGKVFASYVMMDYQKDHSKGKMGFFDRDFNLLPYYRKAFGRIEEQLPKPAKYDEMVEIAEKLSEGIPHVRVDLYYVDNKIYFGEMTFTQANGVGQFEPEEFDEILGRQWNLKK